MYNSQPGFVSNRLQYSYRTDNTNTVLIRSHRFLNVPCCLRSFPFLPLIDFFPYSCKIARKHRRQKCPIKRTFRTSFGRSVTEHGIHDTIIMGVRVFGFIRRARWPSLNRNPIKYDHGTVVRSYDIICIHYAFNTFSAKRFSFYVSQLRSRPTVWNYVFMTAVHAPWITNGFESTRKRTPPPNDVVREIFSRGFSIFNSCTKYQLLEF
jgi:hypothetical protein